MKCTFCGYDIERGTGKIKIMKDGKVNSLCSMKCEKNMFKLKRIPRKVKWTSDYKAEKVMRMSTAAHQNTEKKVEAVKESKAKKEVKK